MSYPVFLFFVLLSLSSISIQAHDHSHDAHAHNAAAHLHGIGHLDLVVEGQQLVLELNIPAQDLLGFEHAPRTPEQQAQLEALQATLTQPEKLFILPTAARCELQAVTLHSSLFNGTRDPASDNHTAQQHADVHAHYAFRCARTEALQQLEIILFQQFPGSTKLLLQAIFPNGQYGGELSAHDNRIRF